MRNCNILVWFFYVFLGECIGGEEIFDFLPRGNAAQFLILKSWDYSPFLGRMVIGSAPFWGHIVWWDDIIIILKSKITWTSFDDCILINDDHSAKVWDPGGHVWCSFISKVQ